MRKKPMENNTNRVIVGDVRESVLERNRRQSELFTSPAAELARRLYCSIHPTVILVLKCMDGRLNLSLYTETPPGIIQPFRNIGGKFDLGWPFFQELLRDGVNFPIAQGRGCLVISSYHFSKGDTHRGCAGFNYDTQAAKDEAFKIQEQFSRASGYTSINNPAAFGLAVGIETDAESLILHGSGDQELRVADLDSTISEMDLLVLLRELYPTMSAVMLNDLLPLIAGNIRHVAKVRASGKAPIDFEHREQVIAVGRGFDWLHMPNTALIVGPYSLAWPENVRVAGSIVLNNLKAGRIPEASGVLLLVAALHRDLEGAFGAALKEQKVRYMLDESLRALREGVPELMPHLKIAAGVVSAETQRLELIA